MRKKRAKEKGQAVSNSKYAVWGELCNTNTTRANETNVSQGGTPIGATPRRVLLGDDDDDEGARFHFAAAFAGSGRIEVGSRKKDVVSFEVEPHGAGAALRRDVFDDGEFVR